MDAYLNFFFFFLLKEYKTIASKLKRLQNTSLGGTSKTTKCKIFLLSSSVQPYLEQGKRLAYFSS